MVVNVKKKVVFYQHFGLKGVVRGAHHKTFDFFHHIKSFSDFEPHIFFDQDSVWDANIPWFHLYKSMPTLKDCDFEPDILFLNSGKDWIKYSQNRDIKPETPIVSPVNNFRATKPGHPSFEFLKRKAIRLCPSPELYKAVNDHPNTVGETIYMPNGVGISETALAAKYRKTIDILIVGNKNPGLANKLYKEIKGLDKKIVVINNWISREDFQIKLANSKLSLHLPKKEEVHYIPGIESMMLDSFVIIPDCVGNRSYSRNHETCVIVPYNIAGFKTALDQVLSISSDDFKKIILNAAKSTYQYSMDIERESLYKALKLVNRM